MPPSLKRGVGRILRARGVWAVPALGAAFLLGGCEGDRIQSTLHPASEAAAKIAWLWWVMCGAFTAVFLLVMVLLLLGVYRRPSGEGTGPPLGGTRFVILGGIAMPTVILLGLLIASLETTVALRLPEKQTLTVEVIGHRWWWEVRYPDQNIVTANEIQIPTGVPVRLVLKSADVIHSFWVPRLNGKMDMIPGHTNTFWIAAEKPGEYRGQCAEYCGLQHAKMAFYVVALPPEAFRAWVAERQTPRPAPEAFLPGQEVFMQAGCKNCHTVRGTAAVGRVGPDLTHLGSRISLGAGEIPNTPGHLGGWIGNSQRIKPGNLMPRSFLAPEELHALVRYLEAPK
ncbi:MAG: cytochrome c oxidase subunit II [Armatimonadetes bacterium]|nr:cytochrome c oxidase subunit II [Armatimonadota bacterium]